MIFLLLQEYKIPIQFYYMSFLKDEKVLFFLAMVSFLFVLFVVFPRINYNNLLLPGNQSPSLFNYFGSNANPNRNRVTIDTKKDYSTVVSTSEGDFTIDLFEKSAPINVSSFSDQVKSKKYVNAPIVPQRDFLFKVDATTDVTYTTKDEINADFLGLNDKKVRDVSYLANLYDSGNKNTKAFSPENLQKYGDYSLKDFYSRVLGYKYNQEVLTPKAKKYTVYMTSNGADSNKSDFFVLMTDSAENADGRYTPIGQVTKGFEVLDGINKSEKGEVTVKNITLESK